MTPDDRRRELARRRMVAYRDRRRRRCRLVPVEVRVADVAALERLGLLEDGERDARAIGRACARFLAAAAAVARIGDALWPDGDGDSA
ncbi:MAG: hypothetical protein AB7P02_02640 [Alphaproteobacteria bacterium]